MKGNFSGRWGADGYRFALITTVDDEILAVDCQNCVAGIEFAQANEAKVGQIGQAIAIALRQDGQMRKVVLAMEKISLFRKAFSCGQSGIEIDRAGQAHERLGVRRRLSRLFQLLTHNRPLGEAHSLGHLL